MTTPKQYKEIWNSHANDLIRLGWNLPEKSDRDELNAIISCLKGLIEKATANEEKEYVPPIGEVRPKEK